MRLLLLTCAAASVAAATASAANPVSATMMTSSTKPLVDVPWRYTITVKSQAGQALAARARLQVLRGTHLVGCWRRTAIVRCTRAEVGTWIPFTGRRTGAILWPKRWVRLQLTFRAVVVTGTHVLLLRAPVTVRSTP